MSVTIATQRRFLFRGPLDDRLHATERVLAAEVAGIAVAYPFSLLRQARVINDTVADMDIVMFWQAGAASALDQPDIDTSRDVGMALMFERRLTSGECAQLRSRRGYLYRCGNGKPLEYFRRSDRGATQGREAKATACRATLLVRLGGFQSADPASRRSDWQSRRLAQ